MDCEACTDRLVELLYGELTDDDAGETRAHLNGCEACSEAFGRIEQGRGFASMLELVDPPVSILDTVMAAARERAADRAPVAEPAPDRAAAPARPDAEEDSGPWSAVLKWIGGFAMRPQLAMAMTLLLMVGLGMWYLPTLRESDPADSHAIVDPAPGDEVGPSASLVPAEPLDLEADPRTGRIRPREEGEEPPRVVTVRPTPVPEEVEEPAEDQRPAATIERAQGLALADPPPTSGQVVEEPLPDPRIAELDVAPGESALPAPRPATQARSAVPAMATEVQSAQMPAMAPTPPAPATEGAGSATDRFNRGLQRLRQRDYDEAAEDFESVIERPGPDTQRLIPAALHNLARSQRSSGNCAAAVRTYDRLLQQHPTYSGVGEALVEGGTCHQRLGRLSEARRWFERARNVPSVAAQANRLLAVLAQEERAADAVTAPESAAAQ